MRRITGTTAVVAAMVAAVPATAADRDDLPIRALSERSVATETVAAEAPTWMEKAAGPRILQLLRRLEQPPPTVVIRPRQPVARDSARGLAAALREGAFAVLDRPIHLEMMLEVMRRILRRHYADVWPMS